MEAGEDSLATVKRDKEGVGLVKVLLASEEKTA
jgi:hypothetical protein